MSVGVDAMLFDKIDAAFGCFEPLEVLAYMIVCVCTDVAEPSLEPHGFGRVHQGAVPVKARVDPAVHWIKAVFQPERHDFIPEIRRIDFPAFFNEFPLVSFQDNESFQKLSGF